MREREEPAHYPADYLEFVEVFNRGEYHEAHDLIGRWGWRIDRIITRG
jgi:hypothetical protein